MCCCQTLSQACCTLVTPRGSTGRPRDVGRRWASNSGPSVNLELWRRSLRPSTVRRWVSGKRVKKVRLATGCHSRRWHVGRPSHAASVPAGIAAGPASAVADVYSGGSLWRQCTAGPHPLGWVAGSAPRQAHRRHGYHWQGQPNGAGSHAPPRRRIRSLAPLASGSSHGEIPAAPGALVGRAARQASMRAALRGILASLHDLRRHFAAPPGHRAPCT